MENVGGEKELIRGFSGSSASYRIIPPRPPNGLKVPQVLPRFIGFATYQFDSNVRKSTMVGLVGACGIGAPLFVAFQRFDYDVVCAILLTIIAVVFACEVISSRIQKVFAQ